MIRLGRQLFRMRRRTQRMKKLFRCISCPSCSSCPSCPSCPGGRHRGGTGSGGLPSTGVRKGSTITAGLGVGEAAKGWLHKKGQKRQNWKRRWCVLHMKPARICYYTDDTPGAQLKGTIPLRDAVVRRADGSHSFMFEVAHKELSGRDEPPRQLYADSSRQLTLWLTAVQKAIAADNAVSALGADIDMPTADDTLSPVMRAAYNAGNDDAVPPSPEAQVIAQRREELLHDVVVARGALLKKGKGSGGTLSRRNWKTRYWKINVPNSLSPDAELVYFASPDSSTPKGIVNLRDCSIREVLNSKYEHHFQVYHEVNHCLMLRAKSRPEMLAWTRVLRIAIAACNPEWSPEPFLKRRTVMGEPSRMGKARGKGTSGALARFQHAQADRQVL